MGQVQLGFYFFFLFKGLVEVLMKEGALILSLGPRGSLERAYKKANVSLFMVNGV